MRIFIALIALLLAGPALAETAQPVGVTSSGAGNGMTVQMSDGSTHSLPSNTDLAKAVGLEGEAAEIFTVPAGDESLDASQHSPG